MKFLSILLLLQGFIFANYAQQDKPVALSGTMASLANKTLALQNIYQGGPQIHFDNKGSFNVKVTLPSGFYSFAGIVLYFDPGMSLNITKVSKSFIFKGSGSRPNAILQQIYTVAENFIPCVGKQLTDSANELPPDAFLAKVQLFKVAAKKLLSTVHESPFFMQSISDQIEVMGQHYISQFIENYGIDPDKRRTYNSIMQSLKPGELRQNMGKVTTAIREMHTKTLAQKDKKILKAEVWNNFTYNNGILFSFSQEYRDLMQQRIDDAASVLRLNQGSPSKALLNGIKLKIVEDSVSDNSIKEYLRYYYISLMLTPGDELEGVYQNYMALAKSPYFIKKLTIKYQSLKSYGIGRECPNFSFTDKENKKVSVSDFRGKYLYIDLWATWCIPCRNEMPQLINLAKKYSQKDIVFLGVSIDRKSDKGNWIKFIENNGLIYKQVLADLDWKSEIITTFNITSIPRYLLIDKEGKMLSDNSKHPTDPTLEPYLDTLLN